MDAQELLAGFFHAMGSFAGGIPPDDFEEYDPEELEAVPVPASAKAVESLPTIAGAAYAGESCSVCRDTFKGNELLKKLPCEHCFHEDCVLRWLRENNTCPLCRFELEAEPQRDEVCCAHEARLRETESLRAALAAFDVEPDCPCEECLRSAVYELFSPALGLPPECTDYGSEDELDNLPCPFCSEPPMDELRLRSHLGTQHNFCQLCKTMFEDPVQYSIHARHSDKHWKYHLRYCFEKCAMRFPTVSSSNLHSAICHLERDYGPATKLGYHFPASEAVYDQVFDRMEREDPICSHCGMLFQSEAAYARHLEMLEA